MKGNEMIRHIREQIGMTQVEFADAIGCKQGFLSFCESGRKRPSIETARKIILLAKTKKIKVRLEEIFPEE